MLNKSASVIDIHSPGIIDIEVEVLQVETEEEEIFAGKDFRIATRGGCLNKILPKLGDMCLAAYDKDISYDMIPGHPQYLVRGIMPVAHQSEVIRNSLKEGYSFADPITLIEFSVEANCRRGNVLSTFWKNKYFVYENYGSIRTDFCKRPEPGSIMVLQKPQ